MKSNLISLMTTGIASVFFLTASPLMNAYEETSHDQNLGGQAVYDYLNEARDPQKQVEFATITREEETIAQQEDYSGSSRGEAEVLAKHKWVKLYQTYGDEIITVKFPVNPVVTQNDGMVSSIGNYKNVAYIFTSYLPPKGIDNPYDFFQFALQKLNTFPYALGKYEIYNDGSLHCLKLKTVNLHSGVCIRVNYVVTPKNLYVMETHYVPGSEYKHDHFFDSFELLK